MREHIIDTTETNDFNLTPFDGYCEVWGEIREKIVRCRDCEMCKEQEIYDKNGNVEGVSYKCARPIMFLEKGGVSTRSMFFGSNLNGMSVVLQNVTPNGFCAWGRKKH